MTDDELAAIERLCNSATPGPWKYTDFRGDDIRLDMVSQDGDGGADAFDHASDWTDLLTGENRYADAALMAYARTDVPALIAEVRRLRELLSQARQVLLPADSCAACAFRLRERMLGDSGPLCCKACKTFILLRSLLEVTP